MSSEVIQKGTEVTLHFALSLEDGSAVDSNFEGKPATFTVGDGSLLPGFEQVLLGLGAGASESFSIPPEQGFGQPNPNNLQQMDRREFDPGLNLEPGLVLSFADANQAELPGVVAEVNDEFVTIDFNHPLAGRTIQFDVKIISVKAA
ncbi:FKBP-type peptidyl-prolyl cis-trans isomerase [Porticoccaceae bacterium LTM1]|nr:FKBP-type peptidyl-prolyl cis-trans isomerase [Porticoccaceae bacterium LTM1]